MNQAAPPEYPGPPQQIRWQVLPDPAAIAAAACHRILAAAGEALADRGRFRLVLAGGRTPEEVYRLLAASNSAWSDWEIFFGDERCLPADDGRRNSVMAGRALLEKVPLRPEQIHPIPAEQGAVEAARRYAPLVKGALPFDLVLLGLGEDGHTASLFPGHRHPEGELVCPVFGAPKPPAERVTLSAEALSRTRQVLVLVTGREKRAAATAWRKGAELPIAQIRPPGPMEVLLDREAAGNGEVEG
jgi:6-phosphogluconolactonase